MSTSSPMPEHEQSDPFGERIEAAFSRRFMLLGAVFEFRSAGAGLMDLVDRAYAGLPPMLLGATEMAPGFTVHLQLTEGEDMSALGDPPMARMQGGGGFFCALMDACNFAIVHPEQRSAVVGISASLLERFPYHARYELLEFAVFLLASRGQQLVSLHAACVGLNGRGLLLLGESGAGKSTLALQCLRLGLDFLTEDAAFVQPQRLRAVGVANFLHLRGDGLAFIDDEEVAAQVSASPVIRRRSGVEKFELDLRRDWTRLAAAPLEIVGLVFLTAEVAKQDLTPMTFERWMPRFMRTQAYATHQAGWAEFAAKLPGLAAFELGRGAPRNIAMTLRSFLDS